jgi:hypothetical protein
MNDDVFIDREIIGVAGDGISDGLLPDIGERLLVDDDVPIFAAASRQEFPKEILALGAQLRDVAKQVNIALGI